MAKILIVDDSDVQRIELREALESYGHLVVEASNGLDGVQCAQKNPDIQLIITDLNMPEMDGISMCLRIREQPKFTKTPIFMLTTESSMELKSAGKLAGVMLWVIKPFDSSRVNTAILKVLEKMSAA